ncbi:MAG: peptide chain release factor 3 [Candidatus Margulisbacteria bacterium GWF2_35_9]|nr:MAG: peptide chain release factor 3 [Candidatus Margulisbacteria bacterium GWF2_35_9]
MNRKIIRRRTLAIISHPDAGKTTLTEKLLLYGGALALAGSVTSKKNQRATTSDWMELEKTRGISISSTVLQFDYNGYRFNLLDTPGHKDFSEDTYRVLMAVDSVIMVIDAAKGIEAQTVRLFEICKKRKIPIMTFINKLDRPAKAPFELIDQIEQVLGLKAFPVNWPIESGQNFKGIYDRMDKKVHLFDRMPGGTYKAPFSVHDITDPAFKNILNETSYENFIEEVNMLDYAHVEFNQEEVLSGDLTPVYFGSASNNFGIELILNGFLEHSNPPSARSTISGKLIATDSPIFSAFVFKIQTNMNPMHRDRMVFARICSGKFHRDLKVFQTRTGKEVRLSSAHNIFGNERETIDESFAGEIIGFVTNTDFKIGDTLSSDPTIVLERIPRFAPELFAKITNLNTSKYKAFRKGIDQLLAEDIVQPFQLDGHNDVIPLLGALGNLQFEVLQYRLKDEYGVDTRLELMPWTALRWINTAIDNEKLKSILPYGARLGKDDHNKQVIFFEDAWRCTMFKDKHQDIELLDFLIEF